MGRDQDSFGKNRKDSRCGRFVVGTYEDEIVRELSKGFDTVIDTRTLMKSEEEILSMTQPFMTDDVLFGYLTSLRIKDFFNIDKIEETKNIDLNTGKKVLVIGPGAILAAPTGATLVYADMARWEIQQRFRRHEVKGLGVDNHADAVSLQYKRGLFIDWRVLDLYKDKIMGSVEYWIDTNDAAEPKMIDADTFCRGMEAAATNPFRVVPFFDPAPWGGQWMKDVCDLDRSKANYGWCFDCVPEEKQSVSGGERHPFRTSVTGSYSQQEQGSARGSRGGEIRQRFSDTFRLS